MRKEGLDDITICVVRRLPQLYEIPIVVTIVKPHFLTRPTTRVALAFPPLTHEPTQDHMGMSSLFDVITNTKKKAGSKIILK